MLLSITQFSFVYFAWWIRLIVWINIPVAMNFWSLLYRPTYKTKLISENYQNAKEAMSDVPKKMTMKHYERNALSFQVPSCGCRELHALSGSQGQDEQTEIWNDALSQDRTPCFTETKGERPTIGTFTLKCTCVVFFSWMHTETKLKHAL